MITLEDAIGLYSDQINHEQSADIEYYQQNLSEPDFIEFSELVDFLNMAKAATYTKRVQATIQELNQHRRELFGLASASNFRTAKAMDGIEEDDEIDRLFREEFGDE